MVFPEKLQLLRRSKGLTQEALAERLGVSRQAIAKWESGQSYPDIANLIALSELLLVTVDRLVKDSDDCAARLASVAAPDEAALRTFLVYAKRRSYAVKAAEVAPSRPASHDYRVEQGPYLYLDTYLGGERFAGEEAVWRDGQPVYAMNYAGRVLHADFNGDFLKAALMRVPEDLPYRGPLAWQEGDSVYQCKVNGDLAWYQGYEEIYVRNTRVYECFFHGGLLG